MLQLANRLNAKVQGDEDEVYDVQEVEQYNDSFLDVYRNESAKKESGNSWLRRLLDLCRDRYP